MLLSMTMDSFMSPLDHRLATLDDLPALATLMERSIAALQADFLDPAQIAASRAVMGLDTQLVRDGTYFAVESAGMLVGCGGWSTRATLFGGDHSAAQRNARMLDPAVEPARIRAMYTDPTATRRGVGRLVLSLCEGAAGGAGFRDVELMATLAGEPLYRACGYRAVERVMVDAAGVALPLIRMTKSLG